MSDATRAQMLSTLHVSLMSFRQDFARELGAVAVEIRTIADNTSAMNSAELNEQFHHLQQTAAHPKLVSHIYLWADPTHQKPLRFDPASGQFERTAWSAEFDPMQQRLLEITTAHHPQAEALKIIRTVVILSLGLHETLTEMRRQGSGARTGHAADDAWTHAGNDDAVGHRSIDTGDCLSHPPALSSSEPVNRADVTWLIIQLNPNVLQKEIFPELDAKILWRFIRDGLLHCS